MAWPPPLMRMPRSTARRTAWPRSTPASERPEPVPTPFGWKAMAKAGRPKRSLSRAAISPTTPGCHPRLAVTRTAGSLAAGASPPRPRRASRRGLDRLALVVQAIELGGDPLAFGRIVADQQAGPSVGIADPPAGIDPRPEQEAEMIGLGRTAEPRRVHQRREPAVAAPRMASRPLATKARLRPGERHHVATVPSATRSSQAGDRARRGRSRSRARRSSRLTATTVSNTSPTAARWPRPERSSWRLGLTIASAGGSRSARLMMVDHDDSRPSRAPPPAPRWLVEPQSTATSSLTPCAGEARTASIFGP